MKKKAPFSLKKRLTSFSYAWNGIVSLIRDEHNARIHVVAAVLVVIAGFFFRVNATEWMLILLCISVVFAAELFNSAIEKLADTITEEKHPLIGLAKDFSAGAVLCTAIGSAVIGLIIFIPYFVQLFS